MLKSCMPVLSRDVGDVADLFAVPCFVICLALHNFFRKPNKRLTVYLSVSGKDAAKIRPPPRIMGHTVAMLMSSSGSSGIGRGTHEKCI